MALPKANKSLVGIRFPHKFKLMMGQRNFCLDDDDEEEEEEEDRKSLLNALVMGVKSNG